MSSPKSVNRVGVGGFGGELPMDAAGDAVAFGLPAVDGGLQFVHAAVARRVVNVQPARKVVYNEAMQCVSV
jgi:hypothetical protein